jgi:hypothetical protein
VPELKAKFDVGGTVYVINNNHISCGDVTKVEASVHQDAEGRQCVRKISYHIQLDAQAVIRAQELVGRTSESLMNLILDEFQSRPMEDMGR